MTANQASLRREPGPQPGAGRLHTSPEERALYDAARCAWCERDLPTDHALRTTCSERCRRARSRARQRAHR